MSLSTYPQSWPPDSLVPRCGTSCPPQTSPRLSTWMPSFPTNYSSFSTLSSSIKTSKLLGKNVESTPQHLQTRNPSRDRGTPTLIFSSHYHDNTLNFRPLSSSNRSYLHHQPVSHQYPQLPVMMRPQPPSRRSLLHEPDKGAVSRSLSSIYLGSRNLFTSLGSP